MSLLLAGPVVARQIEENPSFRPAVKFPVGDQPYGIAAADLIDNDGYPELVVVNSGYPMNRVCPVHLAPEPGAGARTVMIFRNTGDWDNTAGGLVLAQTFAICDNCTPAEVAIADIDPGEPGGPDLIFSVAGAPHAGQPNGNFGVYVARNLGNGVFDTELDHYVTELPVRGLVTEDFDQDGHVDIAAAAEPCLTDFDADHVYVLENLGGVFDPEPLDLHMALPSHLSPGDLALGDFHTGTWGPTLRDLASAHVFDADYSELRNISELDIEFEVHTHSAPCPRVDNHQYAKMASGQFGADSHWDFVAAQWDGNQISVFLGDSAGNFTTYCRRVFEDVSPDFRTTYGVAAGHVNNGTRLDLVATLTQASSARGSVSVLLGKADGTFRGPTADSGFIFDLGLGLEPAQVILTDLNQDGFNDIVTTNLGSDDISVLINTLFVVAPPPGPQ